MPHRSGRHFLQLPGPTNVPDRVLAATARALIDHRGPEFAEMTRSILDGLGRIFRTEQPVFVFPSSATGGWEAALVNTLSPGDRVLAFDQGFFAGKWVDVARRFGLQVEVPGGDWRRPVDPDVVRDALSADTGQSVRALLVVHNETSTGVTTDISAVREAIDSSDHPALLLVDAVSSLGATEYRHEEWRVDVTVCGSQKGLMLPPGLGFNAVSERALRASESAALHRAYWDWAEMRRFNEDGFFPATPATTLLYGLAESLSMLMDEGLPRVFERHARFAEATRRAVSAWGLENYAVDPASFSAAGTTVMMPPGHDADALRDLILERFDMSLGTGLGPLKGEAFRIGHLGDLNELMLAGTLCGVAMGLAAADVPHDSGGLAAALELLAR